MRLPLVAGNWKMHKDHREAVDLVRELDGLLAGLEGVEVAVCPPFTALSDVARTLKESRSRIVLGAQDVYPAPEGAYTGEISPRMLKALEVHYVIVGHSERREIIGEGDQLVAAKARAVLEEGMVPILCVGETLEEREEGKAESKVRGQLESALAAWSSDEASALVIAYEPIWAIGTGKTATPEDAQEMNSFIRGWLAERFGQDTASGVRILYGGSVKPDNAAELMAMPDVDGALVGGASLKAADFAAIARFRE
ncbi:triose-phosphate isomerase [Candidatus Solincola tengchongensis]|uniref:triose-phosphate isomerase n=1 Tax=Candidatus Solincola tengchongensis TaxID=2900693 RepID=UPI00257BC798|nr:triose-phosphate isomerase [Candidatus Solincola tengchongensis]